MASALTSVNGNSARIAHIVTYSSTVALSLVSTNDVRTFAVKILSDSHGNTGFPSVTYPSFGAAEFTMPADPTTGAGWGFLCQTIVNENTPTQSISTFIVGVPATSGIIPIPPGETTERDPLLGWLLALNQILGSTSSGVGDLGNGNVIIGSLTGNQIRHLAGSDIPNATTLASGTMSAADKAALNNLYSVDIITASNQVSSLPQSRYLTVNGITGNSGLTTSPPGGDEFSIEAPFGTSAGTYCQGNDSRLAALYSASLFTFDDLHASLPSSKTLVVNEISGNSNLQYQSVDAHTVSIDAVFGTTGGTYCQGNDSRVVGAVQIGGDIGGTTAAPVVLKIHGATVPTSPDSSKIGQMLAVSAAGAYGLYPASGLHLQRTDSTATQLDKQFINQTIPTHYTVCVGYSNVITTGTPVTIDITRASMSATYGMPDWPTNGMVKVKTDFYEVTDVGLNHSTIEHTAVAMLYGGVFSDLGSTTSIKIPNTTTSSVGVTYPDNNTIRVTLYHHVGAYNGTVSARINLEVATATSF